MKAIFSRKGYDLQYGKYPSIILPNSEMLSFPIPSEKNEFGLFSSQLFAHEKSLYSIFSELRHDEVEINHHLDPNIGSYSVNPKMYNLEGSFGQVGISASHLENEKIGAGDIFLFFGTFQFTTEKNGKLEYLKNEIPFHALYGYLIVDDVIKNLADIHKVDKYKNFKQHIHFLNRNHKSYQTRNQIYIGKKFGRFHYSTNKRLSKKGHIKSIWSLPHFFKDIPITYHKGRGEINNNNEFILQTVGKGQEFVFTVTKQIEEWIHQLISE